MGIFDCPCGQRLKPLLEAELDSLRELEEIGIWDEVALKLNMMSPATIDRKLKHQLALDAPSEGKRWFQARLSTETEDSHKASPVGYLTPLDR